MDTDDRKIKRIRNHLIEDVYTPSEWVYNFYIDDSFLYLFVTNDFETVQRVIKLDFIDGTVGNDQSRMTFMSTPQITDGVIYYITSEDFRWMDGGEVNTYDIYGLMGDFYGNTDNKYISSFIYDGNLIVKTRSDLLFIDPQANEIELIVSDGDMVLDSYFTTHNGNLYYIYYDTLYEYNTVTKESKIIISFDENNRTDSRDYYGYENLYSLDFINGRCFLYMTGFISYSNIRAAELDIESGTVTYLTDYYDDKINILTSNYRIPLVTFEYPNEYSVFIDGGSSGGTILSNFKDHNRIIFGAMSMHGITDLNKASKTVTRQGFMLYYSLDDNAVYPLMAQITDGASLHTSINVMGNIDNIIRDEEIILNIIKSMYLVVE
jgi:hypothetical protein